MDRIDFASKMKICYDPDVTNRENTIVNHFDEIMGLYDVIGYIESSITANIEQNEISFYIETKQLEDKESIINTINNTTICKYYKVYSLSLTLLNDNVINVKLTKISG